MLTPVRVQTGAALVDGETGEPGFEVTRPDLEPESVTWGESPDLSWPLQQRRGMNARPWGVSVGTGWLFGGRDLRTSCFCLTPRSPLPLPGGGRGDNEDEEEEGEGALEPSGPPNPYQMHPPPEGCCTTDGEPAECVTLAPGR